MHQLRRPAIALLVLWASWPTLALGQEVKAGVVTALEGTVTASRIAVPQPVPLKFKDDVFLRDRIATGDRSLARVLLGGKALVTVREHSVLTITEVPGRSTLELETGKIGLAAARERMRPGEIIDIRTPNAVAAIRGTVVVAEVVRAGAQASGAGIPATTRFYVLRDPSGLGIQVTHLDPVTRAPIAPPVNVGVMQRLTVTGSAPATVAPLPTAQVGQVVSGLQPSAPQHQDAPAAQEQAISQSVATAVALVNTIVGPAPPPTTTTATTTTTEGTATTTTTAEGTTTTTEGSTTGTQDTQLLAQPTTTATESVTVEQSVTSPPITVDTTVATEGLVTTAPPPPQVSLTGAVTLGATDHVEQFSGSTSYDGAVYASITGATVSGPGGAPATNSLLVVDPTADVTLTGSLALVQDSTLSTSQALLDVGTGASLTSTGTVAPLLVFDPSTVIAHDVIRIAAAATLEVAAGLLSDVGGTFTATNNFLTVNGTLIDTGPGPLLSFSGSDVTVSRHLVQIGAGGSLTVGGDLVRLKDGSALGVGAPATPGTLLALAGGATPTTATIPGAVVKFEGAGNALSVTNSFAPSVFLLGIPVHLAPGTSGSLSIGGPVVTGPGTLTINGAPLSDTVTGSLILLSGVGYEVEIGPDPIDGSQPEILGQSVELPPLTPWLPATAAVTVSGSTLALGPGIPLVTFPTGSHTWAVPSPFALIKGSSSVSSVESLFRLDPGADVTLAAALALVQDGTLSTGEALLEVGTGASLKGAGGPLLVFDPSTVSADEVIRIASGATVEVTTGLLSDVGGSFSATNNFLAVSGTLTQTGSGPLLSLSGSVVSAVNLVAIGGGAVDLGIAPLLMSVGSTLSLQASLLALAGSSFLTSATPDPLIQVTGGSVSVGLGGPAPLVSVGGDSMMSLAGPLLGPVVGTPGGGTISIPGSTLLSLTGGGGLASATSSPFIDLSGGTLTGGGALRMDGASASLAGPFFRATGTTISAATGQPFIRLIGSVLETGGPLVDLAGVPLLDLGAQPLIRLDSASTLTVGAGPTIRLVSSTLAADALLIADGSGNFASLTGTALDLTDSTVTLRTPSEHLLPGDLPWVHVLALNEPYVRLVRSTLTTTEVDDHLVRVGDNTTGMVEKGVALLATGTPADPSAVNIKGMLVKMQQVESQATEALVQLTRTTVTQAGTTRALFEAHPAGLFISMAGPLLDATDSVISASGSIFELLSGSLDSTATSPFIAIDPSTVTTARHFALLAGGAALSLTGPFLDATDTIFSATDPTLSFFAVVDGASVTTTGTSEPLLKFTGTTAGASKVTAARNFLPMGITAAGDPSPSMSLSGPLLGAVKTDFKTGDPTVNVNGFVFVLDGATLTSTSPLPLLSFDASSIDSAANVFSVRRSKSEAEPSTVTLAGPLFSATGGSTFNTSSLGFGSVGAAPAACCSGFFVGQGAKLESATASALIQLTGSTFSAGPDVESGGSFFNVNDTVNITGELVAPATVSLAGPLLSASASTITALNSLLSIARSSVSSTTAAPFIALADSTVSLGGTDPFTAAPSSARLLTMSSSAATQATLDLAGPLLSATGSTITTNREGFGIFDGSALTSTTASPLVSISGGSATTARNFFGISSAAGLPGSSLSLSGPLFSATGTALANGDPASNVFSFLFVGDSATLASTSALPLLSFDAASVDSSASLLSLRRSKSVAEPTTMTLAGPLFKAINASGFNTSSLGFGSIAAPAACCDGFFVGEGAKIESSTTEALIQLTDSAFSAGPDAQSGGNFFGISNSTSIAGSLVAPATVILAGPLLEASGSSVGALFSLLSIARSSMSSTTTDPLIKLTSSTVALGGTDPFTGTASFGRVLGMFSTGTDSASLDLAGPLLSATGTTITANRQAFGIFDGSTLASTTASPLIAFAGGSTTAGENWFLMSSGSALPASTMTLAGPLLSASGAALANGDPTVNVYSFVWVGDSAVLTSTSPLPLLSFDAASSVNTSGNFFALRRSKSVGEPTTMTLAGPLFAATGGSSFNTTSLGYGSACCNGFFVSQGVTLESSTADALIQLSDSTFNAGPDAQSGGNLFLMSDNSGVGGEIVAPATVSLAGPLLEASGSTVSALFSLLGVTRSSITSTSTDPLVSLSGSTVTLGGLNPFTGTTTFGQLLSLLSSATSGTADTPASITLAGPLLEAGDGSVISSTGRGIGIFNGAKLESSSPLPLIKLDASTLNIGSASVAGSGSLLEMSGLGGATGLEPATLSLAGPLLLVTNGSNLDLKRFLASVGSGAVVDLSGSTDPFISISGGTHSLGTAPVTALISVFAGGTLSVSDMLLSLTDATVTSASPLIFSAGGLSVGGALLDARGGSFTSTATSPFISFSTGGGSVTSPRQMIRLGDGFALSLKESLLLATDTIFNTTSVDHSFFPIHDGASVTTAATVWPLLDFSGTSPGLSGVNAARHFVTMSISTAGNPSPSMTLSGPLLSAGKTDFKTGDGSTTTNPGSLLVLHDSATLASTTTAPLLSFDASSVDASGNIVTIRRSKSVAEPTTMTLAGPLFSATGGSTFNTSSLGFGSIGAAPAACCPGFFVGQGAKLESTTTAPLIQLTGSTFSAGPDAESGGSFFSVSDSVNITGELVAPATVSLAGPLLSASTSTINALFNLLSVSRSSVSSTSVDPLIQLTSSGVVLGGIDPFTAEPSAARIVGLFSSASSAASLSLAGPLLSATGTAITANREAIAVFDGSTLTSTTTSPLISLSGSAVETGQEFFQASSGTGLPASSVTLAGPLLSATGGATLSNGDPTANSFAFMFVGTSATLTSTTPSPLLAFDSASVDSAGNLVSFRTGAAVTLAGPLFSATGGSSFDVTSLGFTSACCNGFRWQGGTTFTSTTPSPLIQLAGSSFNAGPDAQSGGNFMYMSDTGVAGEAVLPASVTLAGPLLSASASDITALYSLLWITRSSLTSTTPSPLIDISAASSVSVGGIDPFVGGPVRAYLVGMSRAMGESDAPAPMTLAGPLLKATGSSLGATGDAFGFFYGATLTSTSPAALVQLDTSSLTAGDPAFTADYQGVLLHVCCAGGPTGTSPTSVSLAGPLLSAVGGSTISLKGNGLHLSLGGLFSSTSPAPLVQLTDSSWTTTNGRFLGVFDVGTAMTLGAGLLQSINSPVTVTKHFVEVWGGASLALAGALLKASDTGTTLTLSTGGSFLSIAGGGVVTKTGVAPLVDLLGTDNDMVRLEHVSNLASVSGTATVTDVLTLEGSLLKAAFAKVSSTGAGTNSSIFIRDGAVVQKSPLGDTSPFVDLDTGTFSVTGALLNLRLSASAALRSKLILGDAPLLKAINGSAVSTSSGSFGTVFVAQGGQLSSTGSGALVQLDGSTLNAAGFPVANLNAVCTGCPGSGDGLAASITLGSGGLLSAVGGSTVTAGAALFAQNSTLTTASTGPLLLFEGSAGTFSSAVGFGEMVRLEGTTLVPDADADAPGACGGGAACIAGDKPLQHAGTVLEARAAATVTTSQGVRLDKALLEATKPLLDLKTGASFTASTTDLIGLNTNAKLTASIPGDALVKLNASTLTVTNGSLVSLTGGSFLKVTGSLLSLVGGSTLTINNGGLVTVAGGSAFGLSGGSLTTFGAIGGNILTINGTPCGVGCAISTTIPNLLGIPVALKNGAVAGNVSVTAGFTAFSGGAPTLIGTTPAVLVVDGATSKIKLTP